MRIVIAGAKGQLGRALVRELKGHQVMAFGHAELDITRAENVYECIHSSRAEMVINAAAYNDVDGAESAADVAYAINAQGPRVLALETAAVGIPLVHISTDYVFDGFTDRPYHEHDTPRPLSEYGASKRAGELSVISLNPRHLIVRTAWLFDVVGKNFLNTMRSLANQKEVRVVCDQVSSPTYAPHMARGIAQLIETNLGYGIYHMAGGGAVARSELVSRMYALLGIEAEVVPVSHTEFHAAAARPAYSALTTMRKPAIVLPLWEHGVREYCKAVRTGTIGAFSVAGSESR